MSTSPKSLAFSHSQWPCLALMVHRSSTNGRLGTACCCVTPNPQTSCCTPPRGEFLPLWQLSFQFFTQPTNPFHFTSIHFTLLRYTLVGGEGGGKGERREGGCRGRGGGGWVGKGRYARVLRSAASENDISYRSSSLPYITIATWKKIVTLFSSIVKRIFSSFLSYCLFMFFMPENYLELNHEVEILDLIKFSTISHSLKCVGSKLFLKRKTGIDL